MAMEIPRLTSAEQVRQLCDVMRVLAIHAGGPGEIVNRWENVRENGVSVCVSFTISFFLGFTVFHVFSVFPM